MNPKKVGLGYSYFLVNKLASGTKIKPTIKIDTKFCADFLRGRIYQEYKGITQGTKPPAHQ